MNSENGICENMNDQKSSPKFKKVILIIVGSTTLVIGGIGVVLPILPTTPFVLCAAGCFSASSPKLYYKLKDTKYFGEYINNYKEKTGISNKARYTGVVFLWVTLIISALIFRHVHVWIILGIVGVAVTIHIMTIRRTVKNI